VEVVKGMMNSICDFLVLTMESGDDFRDGRLPTLDLNIWVERITPHSFSKKVDFWDTLMMVATLSQEVIRRMMNTSEQLDMRDRNMVVDNYAQKLSNSGYNVEQSRKMIVSGLTGYERRLALSRNKESVKWRPLHEGAKYNAKARRNKKMISKNNWYKRKGGDEKRKLETPASRKPLNHPSGRTSPTEDARRAIQQVQTEVVEAVSQENKNKNEEIRKAGKKKAGNIQKDGNRGGSYSQNVYFLKSYPSQSVLLYIMNMRNVDFCQTGIGNPLVSTP
jgi:hypothetical protein